MTFCVRTFAHSTPCGARHSVNHEGFMCHTYVRADGLGACVVSDERYPSRVAFTLLSQLLDEYARAHSAATWKARRRPPHSTPPPVLPRACPRWLERPHTGVAFRPAATVAQHRVHLLTPHASAGLPRHRPCANARTACRCPACEPRWRRGRSRRRWTSLAPSRSTWRPQRPARFPLSPARFPLPLPSPLPPSPPRHPPQRHMFAQPRWLLSDFRL